MTTTIEKLQSRVTAGNMLRSGEYDAVGVQTLNEIDARKLLALYEAAKVTRDRECGDCHHDDDIDGCDLHTCLEYRNHTALRALEAE